MVLKELYGGLWHTTPPDRFKEILSSGAILPLRTNPDGWKTLGGEGYCPYAMKLGGVSLFDFADFDPEAYAQKCPLSSWFEYVPCRSKWGSAVWIEIDRAKVADRLISSADVVAKWKAEQAYRHNFMPYIEAIHVGPLPCTAFTRAFLVRESETTLQPVPC